MDDPASIALRCALVGLLLVLSAFFSSSETAIFSLTKLQVQRLREETSFLNLVILRFVDNPRRLLITSLLGNTFINTAFVTLVTSITLYLCIETWGWGVATALLVATAASTGALLVFGEVLPKTLALRQPDSVARRVVLPLWAASWILSPLRFVIRTIVDATLRLLGIGGHVAVEPVTEDEIREVVTTGERDGIIQRDERRLIDRVFHLREMLARDIMVPRTDMVCADIGKTVGEVFEVAAHVGHSRIPIHDGGIDNIIGILHVKDVPRWRRENVRELPLRDLVTAPQPDSAEDAGSLLRPPVLLPETRRVDALLRDFSAEGTYMAILLDEYGGTAGLITVEDVIEEIVGEIIDEYDELIEPLLEDDLILEQLRGDGVELPAKLSIRAVNRVLRTDFDTEVADTLGGYVYSLFGRIPSPGESTTDEDGTTFQVRTMAGSRIQGVHVRLRDVGGPSSHNGEGEAKD